MESKTKGLTRRDFLKTTAFVGGTGLLATQAGIFGKIGVAHAATETTGEVYELAKPENIIYTTCLQCTVACMVKAKIYDGILTKIDGNPYSATNLMPNLPYSLSPVDAAQVDGKVCPKGQAGIQHTYDPYRLRKVLKRAGARGSGKWKTIPFDQAVDEIVSGGPLFKDIGEERQVPGLKDIVVLKDAKIYSEMAADIEQIRKKKMTVKEFQEKNKEYLDVLIDPEHPDLGPKNNQFLFQVGRIHNGRTEFTKRFVNNAMGSINWIEKTTLCGQTSNKAWVRSTMAYKDGKWSGGVKTPRPDWANVEFVLVLGTIVFEANYGPVQESEPITDGLVSGRLKLAVADPRLTKVASKAWKWLPLKPGTDGALGLAMIRWILENNRFDQRYLENANAAAAKADKETTWSDASYLVKIKDGRPGKYLRADEAGLGSKEQFVVYRSGNFVAVDPNDAEKVAEGDIFVDTVLNGIPLKSALQLLREEAYKRSLDEYADLTGIKTQDIIDVAQEFTAHGKKAAVEFYRGSIKHTNGWYNAQALIALNYLIGNPDWKGGLAKPGGGWDYIGSKPNKPYNMGKLHPGKLSAFGVPLTREGWQYEESTLFAGYPGKRPWYPFSGNVAQETWPSIADGYPYPIKAVLLHSHTPMYSIPGGVHQLRTLLDPNKVPLLIASDIVIGETSMYADYIFPDITYLERWSTGQMPNHYRVKTTSVRQPVIPALTETVEVDGEKLPICVETLMIAVAKKLGLSGFGANGFGKGIPLKRPEDYYLKLVANIAYGDKDGDTVPDADDKEVALFKDSRRHLSSETFDEKAWQKALRPEEWRKVVYVLNRGGRFESSDKAYVGAQERYQLGSILRLYIEEVATSRHSISGNYFSGYAIYQEIQDSMDKKIPVEGDLKLITHKEVFATQSRTISNYWSQIGLQSQNYVEMSRQDAQRLGFKNGDQVRIKSHSNPEGVHELGNGHQRYVEGTVKVMEGILPGVVAVSTSYGHWAYGSNDVIVDGVTIHGDPRRATGTHVQPVFRLDDNLRGTPLSEPIGGSVSYYDTWVTVQKA
ncbi:MAG: molybdopterin-dependent oxidoreductase [Desulfitobacteriaceae bacterium]|nr:molybdopterin-dependent oxidoreductase [Desulfitobacteriaceae bacterium]MDI6913754.1 molybdopterin-dependent oxidoreductase [Desulfitobacteriaceae bacterium]